MNADLDHKSRRFASIRGDRGTHYYILNNADLSLYQAPLGPTKQVTDLREKIFSAKT